MSTDDARSSSTSLRLTRTRSESVFTFMPGSALREHDGTSVRAPSPSTTHTRPTLEAREQLLLPHGADAARHALPAGLVAEELRDAPQVRDHVDALVENEHDARAERRADLARVLEGQRHVDLVRGDEGAGRATE